MSLKNALALGSLALASACSDPGLETTSGVDGMNNMTNTDNGTNNSPVPVIHRVPADKCDVFINECEVGGEITSGEVVEVAIDDLPTTKREVQQICNANANEVFTCIGFDKGDLIVLNTDCNSEILDSELELIIDGANGYCTPGGATVLCGSAQNMGMDCEEEESETKNEPEPQPEPENEPEPQLQPERPQSDVGGVTCDDNETKSCDVKPPQNQNDWDLIEGAQNVIDHCEDYHQAVADGLDTAITRQGVLTCIGQDEESLLVATTINCEEDSAAQVEAKAENTGLNRANTGCVAAEEETGYDCSCN